MTAMGVGAQKNRPAVKRAVLVKLEARAGIEPEPTDSQGAADGGVSASAFGASSQLASLKAFPLCPELVKVVIAWPNLPASLRAAITAIAQTGKGGSE
jgi:hypothetical protein